MSARFFHPSESCAQVVTYGPRGGAKFPRTELWRRNGATQTWRTRPNDYRVPVKYGMRDYGSLHEYDGAPISPRPWHVGTAEDCDLGTLRDSIAEWMRRVGPQDRTVTIAPSPNGGTR